MVSTFRFFWPFIKLGLTDIWRHKARSLLTMLGMVFGVGSVVAMLAVGEGASTQAIEAIKRLGSTNIMIESVKPTGEDLSLPGEGRSRVLNYGLLHDDEIRIKESISGIDKTVPARVTLRNVRLHEKALQLRMIETTPDWFDVVPRRLIAGRTLRWDDMEGVVNVCVLTEHGMRRLLAGSSVIGERVRIGSNIFHVVGILANDLSAGDQAPDSDTDIYIPISAGLRLFGEANLRRIGRTIEGEHVELNRIIVRMKDIQYVEPASKAIESLLRHFHKKMDYKMNVPLMLLREAERSKKMYNVVLGAIAGISLLVGGIGIMNIMLASVTERTKEIGIRRAIGARKNRIVVQFLINTCVISITGGLLGLIVGVAIPLLITALTDVPTQIRLYSLLLAFGISACTGIVFGLYPALRAANLDPIEALRHE